MPEAATATADAAAAESSVLIPDPATSGVSDSTGAPSEAHVAPATTPVEYKLQLPENAVFDATAVERATALAKELKLTPEAAQRMLDSAHSETAAALAAQQERHAQTVKEWRESVLNDNTLGRTPESRQAAIDRGISVIAKYGETHKGDAEALRACFNETGIGNHPTLVRFLAWIGKSMGEPQSVPKGASAVTEVDQRKLWFPNTYKDDAA